MRALVVYQSMFGNTERIARAIADALATTGQVDLRPIVDGSTVDPVSFDLLVVGGPTQRHGASPELVAWLRRLPHGPLEDRPAAAFDTRYRMAKLLSGSAGEVVARGLRRAGCRMVVPPESFFVSRDVPPEGMKRRHELEGLEPGEVERAVAWARELAVAP